MKNGIQRKMMSNRLTMIISISSAQIVMMGIDNEQIIPTSTPPSVHGPPSGTERSLWNGQGKTDSTRSARVIPFMRSI